MNVKLQERLHKENVKLEVYNTESRIPLIISLIDFKFRPETRTLSNFRNGTFIEFSVDLSSKLLYEISVISIMEDSVEEVHDMEISFYSNSFYNVFLNDNEPYVNRSNEETKILRSKDKIMIRFGNNKNVNFFKIDEKFSVGVDNNYNLNSILVCSLTMADIFEIFGF